MLLTGMLGVWYSVCFGLVWVFSCLYKLQLWSRQLEACDTWANRHCSVAMYSALWKNSLSGSDAFTSRSLRSKISVHLKLQFANISLVMLHDKSYSCSFWFKHWLSVLVVCSVLRSLTSPLQCPLLKWLQYCSMLKVWKYCHSTKMFWK